MTMSLRPQTKKQDKNIPSEKAPASFLWKRVRAFVVFCLIFSLPFGFLTGCSYEKKTTRSFFALDTYITITLEGKDADEAMNVAANYIMELERKLSRQDPESEISSLNLSSEGSPVTLSKETYDLLSLAVSYSEKTSGRFDLTIAPVMDLWGFGTEGAHVPEKSEIEKILPNVGYTKVHLLSDNKAYLEEGAKVDLAAILFRRSSSISEEMSAADPALQILRSASSRRFLPMHSAARILFLPEVPARSLRAAHMKDISKKTVSATGTSWIRPRDILRTRIFFPRP